MDVNDYLNSKEYKKDLDNEAQHWSDYIKSTLQYGIPFRCDLRRMTFIDRRDQNCAYEDDPKLYNIVMGKEYGELLKEIIRKSGKVLELGCGPGGLSLELARNGLHVDAIDISGFSIATAVKFKEENSYKRKFGTLNYKIGDLNSISLPENTYDVIFCAGSLHHILKIERLLDEIGKSLKKDGLFLLYDNIGLTKSTVLVRKIIKFLNKIKNYPKDLFNKNISHKIKSNNSCTTSPFEAITTERIPILTSKKFDVYKKKECQAFVKTIATNLHKNRSFNRMIRLEIVRFFKAIDRILCNLKLIKGENILIFSRKK